MSGRRLTFVSNGVIKLGLLIASSFSHSLWVSVKSMFIVSAFPLDQYIRHSGERESVSHSVVSDSAIPWSVALQAPLSMEFSRQGYWGGLPFPSPGDLPNPGVESGSPALQADSLPSEPPGKPKEWRVFGKCPGTSKKMAWRENFWNTCIYSSVVFDCLWLKMNGTS